MTISLISYSMTLNKINYIKVKLDYSWFKKNDIIEAGRKIVIWRGVVVWNIKKFTKED